MTLAASESRLTRDAVAHAAGVTAQAVSNWARRHADFPRASRSEVGDVYATAAVAAWLDGRKIPRPSLRVNEREGWTFGQRFRLALGTAALVDVRESGDMSSADVLDERLWFPLERLLRDSDDPSSFEAIVLSLLCVRDTSPGDWPVITAASAETIREVVVWAVQRMPGYVATSVAVLGNVPNTVWWRSRLRRLVDILGAGRIPTTSAFAFLLDRFARHRQGGVGEYLVPDDLARLMVQLLAPQSGGRIHDPSCGSGSLLVAAGRFASGNPSIEITGRAATARARDIATMQLAVNGLPCNVSGGAQGDLREVDVDMGQFDYVLLNPPFGMQEWTLPAGRPQHEWLYGEPSPHNPAFAWLQAAVEALAPGGRAAVIMPNSATFALSARERAIRSSMVEAGVVQCVISLPSHLFRETTIPVTLWLLTRPGAVPDRGLLLIDAYRSARRDGPTHRVLTDEGAGAVLSAYQEWSGGSASLPATVDNVTATTVTLADLRSHDYDLQPTTYLDERQGVAAEQRTRILVQTREEMARRDAAARAADLALDRCLEGLAQWTR